jgi:hypothetical protein
MIQYSTFGIHVVLKLICDNTLPIFRAPGNNNLMFLASWREDFLVPARPG